MVLQPTEDADALVGQTVGDRFRVTRLIAKGGMAVVYEAEQRLGTMNRRVALKTLRIQTAQDPTMAARFKRECETIAQLSHPNTVRVYDFGETGDGLLYIAMEFVAGKPLGDLMIDVGPMPPERVLSIMRQITAALQEAHALGIVHRDLKPDNVAIQTTLQDREDAVKLLDFGIAVRTVGPETYGKLTRQGMVLGTPPYMSPEQFSPDPIDVRSDVYALGVMAYEMLTGYLPLEADSPWTWAVAHQVAAPKPFEAVKAPFDIPRPMRQAILRALAKSRTDRQDSAKQFFDELSAPSTSPMDAPPTFQPVMGTTPMPAVELEATSMAPSVASVGPMMAGTAVMPSVHSVAAGSAAAASIIPPRRSSKGPILVLSLIITMLIGALLVLGWRFLLPTDEPPPPYPTLQKPAEPKQQPSVSEPDVRKPTRTPRRTEPPRPTRPPPVVSPPVTPTPTPSSSAPAPSATPPVPSLPTGVLQCQSDAQCGFNRCNTQVNRCIWPCTGNDDCKAGATCNPLLGTCIPVSQPAPNAVPSDSPAPPPQ